MILIVDSGSTKTDWIGIDDSGKVIFESQTLGLNPQVLDRNIIKERIVNNYDLYKYRKDIDELYFISQVHVKGLGYEYDSVAPGATGPAGSIVPGDQRTLDALSSLKHAPYVAIRDCNAVTWSGFFKSYDVSVGPSTTYQIIFWKVENITSSAPATQLYTCMHSTDIVIGTTGGYINVVQEPISSAGSFNSILAGESICMSISNNSRSGTAGQESVLFTCALELE